MKFKRFLNKIFDIMLYNPKIDFYTFKIFINEFNINLSYIEQNKLFGLIEKIKNLNQRQLNIKYINKEILIRKLEKEFIKLRK